MIGTIQIVPQQLQQGIFYGSPCVLPLYPIPASVLIQAIMDPGDVITGGVTLAVQAVASANFGVSWQPTAGTATWYSGPLSGPDPPGVAMPIYPGMTHYSGVLNLGTLSHVGLALTWLDAIGNAL